MDPIGIALAALRGRDVPTAMQHLRALPAQLRLCAGGRGAGDHPESARAPSASCPGARQLPPRAPARQGRDGRSVAGPPSAPGPECRRQAGSPRGARRWHRCRRVGDAAPVRTRGPGHGVFELAALDPAVRLRGHRGPHLLLRHGAARRARSRDAGPRIRPAAGRPRRRTCCARCATRLPRPTHAASCTATSRRPTSICAAWGWTTTSSRSSTSAWSKFDDQREIEHTLMGGHHATAGTPAFMAPELIAEGDVDARADVYSLGCVAYYLLTGQLVFEADTAMKMFVQHLQERAAAAIAAHRAADAAGRRRPGYGVPVQGPRAAASATPRKSALLIDDFARRPPLEQRARSRLVAAPPARSSPGRWPPKNRSKSPWPRRLLRVFTSS